MNAVSLPDEPVTTLRDIAVARRRLATPRQLMILDWIRVFAQTRGYPPTLREIGAAFGIKSTNGVNDHLRALERKGYLKREELKSRSLIVVGAAPKGDTVDPAMSAIDMWKAENHALRTLLNRIAGACARSPSMTAEMAVALGDVRAVLKGVAR